MKHYHKINAPFKRDMGLPGNPLIRNSWAEPEFEYLANNDWTFTEKVDGTNIVIEYTPAEQYDNAGSGPAFLPSRVEIGGRTANSQIPAGLLEMLKQRFTPELFEAVGIKTGITLYGEGMGPKINGGGKYFDKPTFVLFDVVVGDWWLLPEAVTEVSEDLGILRAPVLGYGTLDEAIRNVKLGLPSQFGDFEAEGIVATPRVPLFNRAGKRIITKIKARDFR